MSSREHNTRELSITVRLNKLNQCSCQSQQAGQWHREEKSSEKSFQNQTKSSKSSGAEVQRQILPFPYAFPLTMHQREPKHRGFPDRNSKQIF